MENVYVMGLCIMKFYHSDKFFCFYHRELLMHVSVSMQGAIASPTSDLDLFHWSSTIHGLAGTMWEGDFMCTGCSQ